MKKIKQVHAAVAAPIADLVTFRALPTHTVQYLDPFLFLNHHGPQEFAPGNRGLPFGPHPHRGIETVTFILEGDIMHQDSSGYESVINKGGVQWMTAGKGLIHSETSSPKFREEGGSLEILQLWLNLPSKLKMTEPLYKGLQASEIPKIYLDDDKVQIDKIAGEDGAAFHTSIQLNLIHFKAGGQIVLNVPKDHQVFFYVTRGALIVNQSEIGAHQLVEFEHPGHEIKVMAKGEALLLYGHGKPFNEPIVAHGPFVMNSEAEIQQAYEDYRSGEMGNWEL
ncbi:nuclease PIN [Chitinophaga caeni]|uniref:Nuclease PIN n=1 Tax=Chitinophaga caeni TaxID=2029983 RepID=A0A291QUZ3_9BACT|nr:pirin family protein [Chitinophaga caeni]ATL47741.1 nuclease PIN [Chitinophaga caeni]